MLLIFSCVGDFLTSPIWKQQQKKSKAKKLEELYSLLNKTSIITGMEKLDDMEIENEDLRNLIQSSRRRFSTAYTIFQTE